MFYFLTIAVFLFGLIVGSFLNCIIYRLELKEFKKEKRSALRGRSFCPKCGHVLSWLDLIPVLSFFILKGKCRYCDKKISWQYPAVETATALLFLLIFNFQFSIFNQSSILNFDFQIILNTCFLFLISSFLIVIFVFDLKHYIIPDSAIFSAIGIVLIFRILKLIQSSEFRIQNSILAGIGAAVFFLLIVLITKGKGMGIGDIKLAFFMGLFLGYPAILVALFFSFLIGAIIGVILILLKKKTLKSEVPFGPFLIIGTYSALFWSQEIINWYLKLFKL